MTIQSLIEKPLITLTGPEAVDTLGLSTQYIALASLTATAKNRRGTRLILADDPDSLFKTLIKSLAFLFYSISIITSIVIIKAFL